jgi:hypothetical protein
MRFGLCLEFPSEGAVLQAGEEGVEFGEGLTVGGFEGFDLREKWVSR